MFRPKLAAKLSFRLFAPKGRTGFSLTAVKSCQSALGTFAALCASNYSLNDHQLTPVVDRDLLAPQKLKRVALDGVLTNIQRY